MHKQKTALPKMNVDCMHKNIKKDEQQNIYRNNTRDVYLYIYSVSAIDRRKLEKNAGPF